jgi:tRNA pseudouridine38-40 synthase
LKDSRRIRITLAYDGTDFHGWQVQPGLPTIQGALEAIVSGMERRPVHVAGSGRTDAGVHARAQVAAFTFDNPIPMENLIRAMNRLLPPAIRVLDAVEVDAEFHPRFEAIAKTYQYTMVRTPLCLPFDWRYAHHHPYPLNEDAMMQAARVFEGEHDFGSMAAADEKYEVPGYSKVRRVFSSRLERTGDKLVYTVRGSGFLKHMVRNIVGTLIEVGRGNREPASVLVRAGATVPAKGLTMVSVEYPVATPAGSITECLRNDVPKLRTRRFAR